MTKIGFDLHRVVDADPSFFVDLALHAKKNGCEVHIITGQSFSERIYNTLIGYNNGEMWWTHYFSIDAELLQKGLPYTIDKNGNRHYNEEAWNRSKAEYCKINAIDLHIDDSQKYLDYFETPVLLFQNIPEIRADLTTRINKISEKTIDEKTVEKHKDYIITSLLDTDFYKYTMAQAVLHQCAEIDTEFAFKCRNTGIFNWDQLLPEINEEIDHLCTVTFPSDELAFLRTIPYFKKGFIDHLQTLRLNRDHIQVWCEHPAHTVQGEHLPNGGLIPELHVKIKWNWFLTIWFEVPVLAIINEVYFRHACPKLDTVGGFDRLIKKVDLIKTIPDFKFSDFGTRRRFSKQWQRIVLQFLKSELPPTQFIGTSNVLFAKELNLKYIGTMAHEWIMAGQQIGVRLDQSQTQMLQRWVDEYRGELGYALTDTIGIDAFLVDFDKYFAKLYDGVRCDSGDPFDFGEKMIAHYEKLHIDPKTKYIIFSDSLSFPKAKKILEYFRGRINVSFGIGTNLMNDFPDVVPLQIVIKMVECNGQPVAKISDSPEKGMCRDPNYVAYLKSVFDQKIRHYNINEK